MSKVELESFLKSFFLFFSSLTILIVTLFYFNYQKDISTLDEKLLSQMRVCSYDLKCKEFDIDFIPLKKQEFYRLYKLNSELSSYYPIPNSEQYTMEIKLQPSNYNSKLQKLQKSAFFYLSLTLLITTLLSVLFSFYSLHPLRNALLLTQEFIKDILHDFNTPLATLRLNSSMLKKELGDNNKIQRIESSVQNILNLQSHLKSYLQNSTLQKEEFDLEELIDEMLFSIRKNYPDIEFSTEIKRVKLFTNKDAFTRILDNLLTNAAKYNKENGSVTLSYHQQTLEVIDSGKGIKKPQYIFERFYKEQDRGIGIGLHIVKKLCDELGIKISVESQLNEGSTFKLMLSKLTVD